MLKQEEMKLHQNHGGFFDVGPLPSPIGYAAELTHRVIDMKLLFEAVTRALLPILLKDRPLMAKEWKRFTQATEDLASVTLLVRAKSRDYTVQRFLDENAIKIKDDYVLQQISYDTLDMKTIKANLVVSIRSEAEAAGVDFRELPEEFQGVKWPTSNSTYMNHILSQDMVMLAYHIPNNRPDSYRPFSQVQEETQRINYQWMIANNDIQRIHELIHAQNKQGLRDFAEWAIKMESLLQDSLQNLLGTTVTDVLGKWGLSASTPFMISINNPDDIRLALCNCTIQQFGLQEKVVSQIQ